MFATQFKAEKPPVEKNSQYTFNCQQGVPCRAWVATGRRVHERSPSLAGNHKEALDFIKKNVKSADFPNCFRNRRSITSSEARKAAHALSYRPTPEKRARGRPGFSKDRLPTQKRIAILPPHADWDRPE